MTEHVSDSDRQLIARMKSRLVEIQVEMRVLNQFIGTHLTETYSLQAGDQIEDDGRITRQSRDTTQLEVVS